MDVHQLDEETERWLKTEIAEPIFYMGNALHSDACDRMARAILETMLERYRPDLLTGEGDALLSTKTIQAYLDFLQERGDRCNDALKLAEESYDKLDGEATGYYRARRAFRDVLAGDLTTLKRYQEELDRLDPVDPYEAPDEDEEIELGIPERASSPEDIVLDKAAPSVYDHEPGLLIGPYPIDAEAE